MTSTPIDQQLAEHVAERDTETAEPLIENYLPNEIVDFYDPQTGDAIPFGSELAVVMQIRTKRLSHKAKLPTYATDGSGAFDLYATEDGSPSVSRPVIIGTGIAIEIPPDYVMLLFSRSGHGFRDDVRLSNCVGVIDSDYRGEIKIKLVADQPSNLQIEAGDRIAQGVVIPIPRIEFVDTDTLSETSRGDGGFGSTGA